MKDERKKCRVFVSCEIFEKKEKNLKTQKRVCCVFFWLCKCVKKLFHQDALELHMLRREAKQHDAFYPIHISKGQKIEPN
jgi:hypothetical protein